MAITSNTTSEYDSSNANYVFDAFAIVNVVFIFIIMVGVGISLDVSEARKVFKQKTALAAATFNQYVVVPLLLWGFARADTNLPLHFRAAMVVVGTCPGGVLSNVLCMWLHADPNLSITITSWTVLLSLGTLPLNLYLYLQLGGLGTPPPTASSSANSTSGEAFVFQTDWVGLGVSFAAVLGGNIVGIILQRCITTKASRKRLEGICLFHGIPQAGLALASNAKSGAPVWRMPINVYFLLLAPTFIAFFWAMLSSHYFLRLPKPSSAAVAIEASVQNVNIGIGILSLSIKQPNLRAESLGVPLAHSTITLVQCVLFGLFLWRAGWTELDPRGRDPCSIWLGEYLEHCRPVSSSKMNVVDDTPTQADPVEEMKSTNRKVSNSQVDPEATGAITSTPDQVNTLSPATES